MLAKCAYWLYWYDLLFGENAVAYTVPFDIGAIKNLAFFLYSCENTSAGLYLIIGLMLITLLHLAKIRVYFISDFIAWLIVLNVHNKIYPTLSGGEYLLNQLLFYNCFICQRYEKTGKTANQFKILAHNFGVLSVIAQVGLVYFISALLKIMNESWLNGTAIVTISQVRHFSVPFIYNHSGDFKPLLVFLNYFVLFYQLLFPLLVWIRKIKKPFLIAGILMHLYIAFVMGLVSFGFIMILCYVYFWPKKTSTRFYC